MTDELLTVVNRRTAIAAVRQEAARAGLDAEQLLDSKTLYNQVTGLDVDDPGFPRRVSEIVQGHATARGLTSEGSPTAAAPATASPTGGQPTTAPPSRARQWTEADVAALPKTREGSRRLQEAMDAGLLADLGYGVRRRRRRDGLARALGSNSVRRRIAALHVGERPVSRGPPGVPPFS